MRKLILTLAITQMAISGAYAGVQNDVPSCYLANQKLGLAPLPPEKEVFILIDQTTVLDTDLKSLVLENAGRLVKPGNAFTIATFSSFAQGHYLRVVNSGALEVGAPEKVRNDSAPSVLKSFDACLAGQAKYGQTLAANAIRSGMEGATSGLAKSDVLAALKDLSARVKASPARDKVVFVVSDMLENSSISSFYAQQNVRKIEPTKELAAAEAAKMVGDFGGARIFVLGAGIVPEDKTSAKGVYRDPKTMGALKDFWTQYFTKSSGDLTEFGAPALMRPVN